MNYLQSVFRKFRLPSWGWVINVCFGRFPRPLDGPPPDKADVFYGEHPLQKLDFWGSPSEKPSSSPVLIFFHGGGFHGGKSHYSRLLREARLLGISVVSVSYRLSKERGVTIEHAMKDAERAVKFICAQAEEWRIDPSRLALAGNSAGGCMALWLAFTGGCDVTGSDPEDAGIKVNGKYIKPRCVVTYNAITSIDPLVFSAHLGVPLCWYYRPLWVAWFGLKSKETLHDPRIRSMIDSFSPLLNVKSDVPPTYLKYSGKPPEPEKQNKKLSITEYLHSAGYGELLEEKCRNIGAPCTLTHQLRSASISDVEFLRLHLLEPRV